MQNLSYFYWDEEEVNQRLTGIMKGSFNNVWDYSKAQVVPMRMGAMMLAVDKVAAAAQQTRHLALIGRFWQHECRGVAPRPRRVRQPRPYFI